MGSVSKDELAKHKTQSDCWIAISGKVYNVVSLALGKGGVYDVYEG